MNIEPIYKIKNDNFECSVCIQRTFDLSVPDWLEKEAQSTFQPKAYPDSPKRWLEFVSSRKLAHKLISQFTYANENSFLILPTQNLKNFGALELIPNPQGLCISITHSGDLVGVALSHNLIGVDLEIINETADQKNSRLKAIERSFSDHEQNLASHTKLEKIDFNYLIWTAKESVSKALQLGFKAQFNRIEIDSPSFDSYKAQYGDQHFAVQSTKIHFNQKNYILSVATSEYSLGLKYKSSY